MTVPIHNENLIGEASTRHVASEEVISAVRRSTSKSAPSSVDIAQLCLKNMKLHGRENETSFLKTKLDSLVAKTENKGCAEIILVAGISGTGKSALVARGLHEPSKKLGAAFAGGKFDLNKTALPLSAFSEAMTSLAKHILKSELGGTIVKNIKGEFSVDDLMLFSSTFPKCGDLFGHQLARGITDVAERQTGKEIITRQQYATTRLLKIICRHMPVVLFIDDLQVR